MAGKKGRSGPPVGSMNALKTGSKLSLKRLVVGELPSQLRSVKREARAYRRNLEAAVLEAQGVITVTDAHHIDTASGATAHAGVCRWLLRNKIETMNPAEILSCSKEIIKAKQARDSAVKMLELDAPPPAPWVLEIPSADDAHSNLEDK